ncbi:MAG: recombinase RecB [Desulfurococcales archaeon]|nr:recombinase RecB [Desulfurococcales archaeon]MCE4605075.1 recombinase RecB [Desulfurococcales archaeon]
MGRSWRSSEAIAAQILEDLGYTVVDKHVQVEVDGVQVSDVDLVAEKEGIRYAVEVKAGMADVNAVRQAYVNAKLTGMRPLIIARGADDRALKVSERLGVEIITLPDLVIAGVDDVREIVEEAVWSAIVRITSIPRYCKELGNEDLKVLEAIASTDTISEAAEMIGASVGDVARVLDKLRKLGLMPKPQKYGMVKALASLTLILCR